jgi:hypothetical protein
MNFGGIKAKGCITGGGGIQLDFEFSILGKASACGK